MPRRRLKLEVWETPRPEVRYCTRVTYTTIVVTVLNDEAASILEAIEIALQRSEPKKVSSALVGDSQ